MPERTSYRQIKNGLAPSEVARLVKTGKLAWNDVYGVVPERTFKRRLAEKRHLSLAESDAVARLLHIQEMARWAFTNKARADAYLSTSNPALGHSVPWEMAKSEAGAREVEAALIRFVHGVYA